MVYLWEKWIHPEKNWYVLHEKDILYELYMSCLISIDDNNSCSFSHHVWLTSININWCPKELGTLSIMYIMLIQEH